ncbi:histidine kinase [Qipengyuania sp. 1NDW9]|uniref:Histidine kinase n=1 Tax=Qipengyuania xiapuensis TaxID=2867236 RepID=A0ABX8ZR82_9SPHN|nr:histidine kinase [Qipengyuania xiapuensis]MBX7491764.1 histidine kinase [Qipengyuania xiapuensis]QZD91526.1 histidine kinase [Qipengyuania xiapuensis]
MAVLPLSPTPFFANKNQAFWNLQLAGWGGTALLRAMSAFANGQPLEFFFVILIATITGFSISLILSVVYGYLIRQRPLVTWGGTALVLGVAVGAYAFIDSWVLGLTRSTAETGFVRIFIGIYFFDLTLLGAWSALYYAINFFLQVEQQADRLERLEAQATSAQLAMLRYQLNPHFLFNTLNSISTLVLLKQSEPANAMLTRLSSFLRHTLVTQPGGKVTVAQEVETLKLYLDIERMRFEERLQTEFRVEEAASKAQIPSMLLQPLIENAIKYGVSPQEEGATISLLAQIVGPRLRITVSDTGPGVDVGGVAEDLPAVMATHKRRDSTGVGLANIRDRLAQAYGDDHRFEIRSPESGGFTVLIEIPHEFADAAEPSAEGRSTAAVKPATPQSVESPTTPQKVSTAR